MTSTLPKLSRVQTAQIFVVAAIAGAGILVSLSSLEWMISLAPLLAVFVATTISVILYLKGMFRSPWIFIAIGIWVKAISWVLLSFYWPEMASPDKFWPFTCNAYYAFDVLGSMLILGFGSYLVSFEQKHFRYGLIADSSLLFISALLVVMILKYDAFLGFFETLTAENVFVRLQVIPFTYYLFVSIIVIFTLGNFSRKGQVTYFLCIIPFSLHAYIEAYASYVPVSIDQQLLYARVSAICYYLAAFTLFLYILFVDINARRKTTARSETGLSPLIWVASSTTLLLPPAMIYARRYFSVDTIHAPHNYLLIFIASMAIFIRFLMLIFQAKQQQSMLNTEASYDELTDILNRRGFMKKLTQAGRKDGDKQLFCLLDINNFKSINDTCGHHVGDQVLQYIAGILDSYPTIPLSARLGGDEFVMVLQVGDNKPEEALQALHESLASWQYFDGKRIYVGVSIGATYLKPEIDFSLLYTSADYALYQAKNNYSGTVINQSELTAAQINARLIPDLIQDALDTEQICLHFQPIYDLHNGRMSSIEVLMRLRDDEGRIYMPSQFLEMAIKHNKIMPLTRLLLSKLTEMSSQLPDVKVAINFPPAFFEDDIARQQIITELDKFETLKPRLSLEITEEFNSDVQVLRKAVSSLRKEGYCFALDDFGAGSASLARLAYLPVDIVKIDISLLRAAEQGNIAPLESVVALAKRLKSKVVVEGIETPYQLSIARRVRADMGQGYFFSKPVELVELLRLPGVLPEFNSGRLLPAY